jgi:uncharacterized membrane protein
MRNKTKIGLAYVLTLAGILIWLGAVFLAPYLQSRGIAFFRFIYGCFSTVCHQKPTRSFFIFGHPVAVCARCLGIYLGFLGGLVVYPLNRGFSRLRLPDKRFFFAVSAPIVLDTAANVLGFWNTSNAIRFALGFSWGLILPFYFLTGIGELVLPRKKL